MTTDTIIQVRNLEKVFNTGNKIHALNGVSACVVAMIANSVIKLGKSSLKDKVTAAIFLVVLVLAFFWGISPVLLVVCSGLAGYTAKRLSGMGKDGEGK